METSWIYHCIYTIGNLLNRHRPCRFKIGMTGNATKRWYGSRDYYNYFDAMHVLCACVSLDAAWALGCALIDKFWDERGSVNRDRNDPGGSGNPPLNLDLYYLYICVIDCNIRDSHRKKEVESRTIPAEVFEAYPELAVYS